MSKLPNGDHAQVDLVKLTSYVLDPGHRTGRHKARVFAAALGLTQGDAPLLRTALLEAASTSEAVRERGDAYGVHYSVEFMMQHDGRQRMIRSLWAVRSGEDFPRFVSAFVKEQHDG